MNAFMWGPTDSSGQAEVKGPWDVRTHINTKNGACSSPWLMWIKIYKRLVSATIAETVLTTRVEQVPDGSLCFRLNLKKKILDI